MHFSMDELGYKNNEIIKALSTVAQRWDFIIETAYAYGFDGIHITPSLYQSFGLDVNDLPADLEQFHLTYHLGGSHRDLSTGECFQFEKILEKAFNTAIKYDIRDISLHPPVIEGFTPEEKELTERNFSSIVERWSSDAKNLPFSLSLETHLYEPYFLFRDYIQYKQFSDAHANMGILIDISHNFFSGYSEQNIIDTFIGSNVSGLHISDAIQYLDDKDLAMGTHLAIGDGEIDFMKLISQFAKDHEIFAALEIKAENDKIAQSLDSLKQIIKGVMV